MKAKAILLLSALVVSRLPAQDSTHASGEKFVDRRDGVSFAFYDGYNFDPVLHKKYIESLPPGATGFIRVAHSGAEQLQSVITNREDVNLDSAAWMGHVDTGIRAAAGRGYTDLIDRSSSWTPQAMSYVFVVYNPNLQQYQYTACRATTAISKRSACVYVRTPKKTGYEDLLDRIVIGEPASTKAGG